MSNHDLDWNRLDKMFDEMGRQKDRPLSQFWDWSRAGDQLAQNTGLMIMQIKPDFELDMMGIGGSMRQARRVSRHLVRIAAGFETIRGEFKKIPATISSAYEQEIQAQRRAERGHRNRVNPAK